MSRELGDVLQAEFKYSTEVVTATEVKCAAVVASLRIALQKPDITNDEIRVISNVLHGEIHRCTRKLSEAKWSLNYYTNSLNTYKKSKSKQFKTFFPDA